MVAEILLHTRFLGTIFGKKYERARLKTIENPKLAQWVSYV